jgi:transketolase
MSTTAASTPELGDPRQEFGKALVMAARKNPAVVAIAADSGTSSGLGEFQKTFPERYFQLGIMEQGAVGVAAGFATTGKIPVFCGIATFVTGRPFEMVRNDCGYMKQNVKLIGRNGGLNYADLGPTHYSIDDFAIMSIIPGITILAPQDPVEIKNSVAAMIEYEGPVYMRVVSDPIPVFTTDKPFRIGKGEIMREGKHVTLISTGTLTYAAIEAADELWARGIDVEVIGMPTINPIDKELIISSARKTGKIVTVEEHYVPGGMGSIVQNVSAQNGGIPVKMLGLPKTSITTGSCYKELIAYYGLDAAGIANSVREFCEG